MIAYCGLDCLECDAYKATMSGDQNQVEEVAEKWRKMFNPEIQAEHILCNGCKSEKRKSYYCDKLCEIRSCAAGRGYDNCAECDDYICSKLQFIVEHAECAKIRLEEKRIELGK